MVHTLQERSTTHRMSERLLNMLINVVSVLFLSLLHLPVLVLDGTLVNKLERENLCSAMILRMFGLRCAKSLPVVSLTLPTLSFTMFLKMSTLIFLRPSILNLFIWVVMIQASNAGPTHLRSQPSYVSKIVKLTAENCLNCGTPSRVKLTLGSLRLKEKLVLLNQSPQFCTHLHLSETTLILRTMLFTLLKKPM